MKQWVGDAVKDQIVFLPDDVQKPFSGVNKMWRRWTRTSYAYVGNTDLKTNILNEDNPRAKLHAPLTKLGDRGASNKVLAADMVWLDQFEEGANWGPVRINHSKKRGVADYQNVLYGDGSVSKTDGDFLGESLEAQLREKNTNTWVYTAWPGGQPVLWW